MTITTDQMKYAETLSEDRGQEFLCLLLEGHDEDEAFRLSARVEDSDERGPRTAGRNGKRPLHGIPSDWSGRESCNHGLSSVTQDERTVDEREEDWASAEDSAAYASAVVPFLCPLLREAVLARYTSDPARALSMQETADKLGVPFKTAERRIERARKILRHAS